MAKMILKVTGPQNQFTKVGDIAELWAVFDDRLSRQPSLQQNFGQCLMTVFKDSHHFSRTLGSV